MFQQGPSRPEEVAAQRGLEIITVPDPNIPNAFGHLVFLPDTMYQVDDNDGQRRRYSGAHIRMMSGIWKMKERMIIFERSGFLGARNTNMTNGGS